MMVRTRSQRRPRAFAAICSDFDEVPEPGLVSSSAERKQVWSEPLQLPAKTVDAAVHVRQEVVVAAPNLAQFDKRRIGYGDRLELRQNSAESVSKHESIPTVILRAGDGVAVTKAVQLLRVEREDRETVLNQRLDHWSMGNLDRNGNTVGFACMPLKPSGQLR